MCGRYNIIDDPYTRALLEILDIHGHLETRYNIAPTERVPVIRQGQAGNELSSMRWWLVPSWVKEPSTRYSMFNARAEGLVESRAFRHSFKRQRCILPASSFIEWHTEDGKQPYEIRAETGALAFAGLWECWGTGAEQIYSCAMITTDAVSEFRDIHTRMPVMLAPDMFQQWLEPAIDGKALMPFLLPQLPTSLLVVAVDPRINLSRLKEAPEPISEVGMIVAT
ncbi:SOS response-associated peptidase [Pontibacterium sp. N1Y112]|uniref:Abasic site processing protein n=1 Tax=Pontibacterium sinense TaxID=2781979 RepID=A0A8J7K9T0_9GAMM|nr:SOS response-associated peptidase [Pontibacterium sinense]MBE9397141.1 SOS response-associated peptidase [Pontibacterium sinense]